MHNAKFHATKERWNFVKLRLFCKSEFGDDNVCIISSWNSP